MGATHAHTDTENNKRGVAGLYTSETKKLRLMIWKLPDSGAARPKHASDLRVWLPI